MTGEIATYGYSRTNLIAVYGYGISGIKAVGDLDLTITIRDGLKLLIQHG